MIYYKLRQFSISMFNFRFPVLIAIITPCLLFVCSYEVIYAQHENQEPSGSGICVFAMSEDTAAHNKARIGK